MALGYFDPNDPVWQQISAQSPGVDYRDYMYLPYAMPPSGGWDTTPVETYPGSNEWYSPADIAGGGYSLQLTPEAVARRQAEADRATRNLQIAGAAMVAAPALLGVGTAAAPALAGTEAGGFGGVAGSGLGTFGEAAGYAAGAGAGAGAAAGFGGLAGSGLGTASEAAGYAAGAGSGAEALAPITVSGSYLPAVGGATVPYVAPGAMATGGGGALASLGLPGWLTIGSLAAGALQGNKPQTTTTSNEPPAYIAPYLSDAAAAARAQYGIGAYVSPFQQAAENYGRSVLNGDYLNANPYLNATFQRAAGAVTNQVQSAFGNAGRNVMGVDAAANAVLGAAGAGGGYNDLANQIYGGNYQAERNRQQQILPMTDSLGKIGNPQTALDDFIARLRNISGGYGTNTSTTPTQSNLFSGLAGLGLALIPGG